MAPDDSGFAADDETALKAAQLLETGVNPKPQDAWRAALGKKSEAVER